MVKLSVIDTETTGVEANAKVVEIAAIPLEQHPGMTRFKMGSPIQTLVHPGIPIPATASAIHHITDADVRNAPSFDDALHLFRGADVYVAHNAGFDRKFVGQLGDKWICTMKCAYEEFHDAPSYGNQALSYWLGTPRPPEGTGHAHRALYDCYTTLGILDDLRSRGWTIERMLEVSSRPRLLRVCTFGKHNGTPWADVPRSYLEWMNSQGPAPDGSPAWDEDTSHTVRHYLGER
ncbi:MAG: exodeoxyribonuclease X [Alphaproteobacteria bacterium]|nr:exodeoxyribonuclease X [Hyphomonas sp.]MBR9807411.1 exodeoxyribonuclease X [Alphaproteobacteria bacterium]